MKDGPQLNFGFNDVDYPFNDGSYEASLRIGLPQLKKLKDTKGFLQIPLHSVSYQSSVADKTLTFIGNDNNATDKVYVATTNDPLWNAEGAKLLSTPVATLSSSTLAEVKSDKQYTLDLKFSDDVLKTSMRDITMSFDLPLSRKLRLLVLQVTALVSLISN